MSYERLSFEEIQELHRRMSEFVASFISNTDNNRSAKLAPYGQCNTRGTHISAPIFGCTNVSSVIHREVAARFGPDAEVKTEISPDSRDIYANFVVPIYGPRAPSSHGAKNVGVPSFQTPFLLLLVDLALAATLSIKLGLI